MAVIYSFIGINGKLLRRPVHWCTHMVDAFQQFMRVVYDYLPLKLFSILSVTQPLHLVLIIKFLTHDHGAVRDGVGARMQRNFGKGLDESFPLICHMPQLATI